MARPLDPNLMRDALANLDGRLDRTVQLVIGKGAAMLLAYGHPLATQDVDAFTRKGSARLAEIDAMARQTAKDLDIAPDWLNQHFDTFTHVLPDDYAKRLRLIFEGRHLTVDALGPEDIVIMKCFAGRDKDRPHIRRLLRIKGIDLELIDRHLALQLERGKLGAQKAADYFDDLRDELGV